MTHHQKTYVFHTDCGHGWLEVTNRDLEMVGLRPCDFSQYSYQRVRNGGTTYYLEEDCDATTFLLAYRAMYSADPKHTTRDHGNAAPCRNYRRISNTETMPSGFPRHCYVGNAAHLDPSDADPGL